MSGGTSAGRCESYAEKLELLMRLNAAERVTWQGRFRPPLNNAPIPPRLAQNHLPIWVGTGGRVPRCGEAQRPCVCCNRYFLIAFTWLA
jgi:alkanesulfonate monooxygenase SsuD/methylene tetrahydromethanopterin reductase-like flavin-dependent oxidoreductase (luciferase family)